MITINLIRPRFPVWCPITGIAPRVQSLPPFENPNKTQAPVLSSQVLAHNAAPSLSIVGGNLENALSERVLVRLSQAESKEIDPWLRDDIRIAWLTVLHCAEGISQPWEFAFWRYLGKHPDKLIPFFVERSAKHAAMEPTGERHSEGSELDHSSERLWYRTENPGNFRAQVESEGTPRRDEASPANLYQSAAEEISLPPKKQPSPINPKKEGIA